MKPNCLVAIVVSTAWFLSSCTLPPTRVSYGDREQVLFRGNGAEPQDVDPHIVTGVAEDHIITELFEGLVSEDPHDLSVVKHISDRIAVMYLGKIVELGFAAEVVERPLHPYTKALVSAVPLPDPRCERQRQRIILPGDPPSPMNPPGGCPFHPRCPHAVEECSQVVPAFEPFRPNHEDACLRLKEIN